MTQPIRIEIHLHIHADGAVTVQTPNTDETNARALAATPEAPPSSSPVPSAARPSVNTKPVEPPASYTNADAPAAEEAAAPVPAPAGKPDRNPNLLRTALYDASKRVGKDAALEVVARLAGGSLRNVTDETFDNVLNNLNALQKE